MLQPVLDVLDGTFVNQVQRCTSACLLDDLRKVFGTIAECIGIISYRTVYAVVFVSTVISEGFTSLLRCPNISQKMAENKYCITSL